MQKLTNFEIGEIEQHDGWSVAAEVQKVIDARLKDALQARADWSKRIYDQFVSQGAKPEEIRLEHYPNALMTKQIWGDQTHEFRLEIKNEN
jgi:hypothetical protein